MAEEHNLRQSVIIILATTLMSLALGYTMPLLAITLKAAGATQTQIGISAAAPPLAILLSGFSARRVIAFLGFRAILCMSAVVLCGGLLALSATMDLYVWFVTRAVIGATNGVLWISLESWLNHVTPPLSKGRVVGLYAAATTLAFACGSLLPMAERDPRLSFVAAAALFGVGIGVCLFVQAPVFRSTNANARAILDSTVSLAVECAMALAAGVLVSVQIALLPTVPFFRGLGGGKDLLSASLFGAIAAQLLTGVVADRWGSERVVLPLVLAGIAVSGTLLPEWHGDLVPVVLYFCWGGVSNALYSVALTRLGIRKSGHELLVGNAALLLSYETGTLLGPVAGGMLSDRVGVAAFPWIGMATFGLVAVVIGGGCLRERARLVGAGRLFNAYRGKAGK